MSRKWHHVMRTVPSEWPEFPDHRNNLWSGRRNYHKVIKWAGPGIHCTLVLHTDNSNNRTTVVQCSMQNSHSEQYSILTKYWYHYIHQIIKIIKTNSNHHYVYSPTKLRNINIDNVKAYTFLAV